MATTTWKFLINTFYVRTWKSFKNALTLTQDHLAKLTANEGDADIAAIKTAYLIVHNAFVTAYNQLNSKLGIYHGKTQTFEEMLEELGGEKINEWRGQVFAVFPEGTADALAIFPRDRQPFQQDTYDQIVENVKALSLTLATYITKPTLVTLSATVDAYYITFSGARALQQTDEGSVDTLRSNLRAAHKLMCDGMYKDLGLLMAKYYQTPERVEDYYDLSLLRTTGEDEPVIIEGDINGGQVINVNQLFPEDIEPGLDTIIKIKNTSANPLNLVFYSANNPTDFPGPGAGPQFTVASGASLEKTIADFQVDTYNSFNIYNSTPIAGSWEIEIDI